MNFKGNIACHNLLKLYCWAFRFFHYLASVRCVTWNEPCMVEKTDFKISIMYLKKRKLVWGGAGISMRYLLLAVFASFSPLPSSSFYSPDLPHFHSLSPHLHVLLFSSHPRWPASVHQLLSCLWEFVAPSPWITFLSSRPWGPQSNVTFSVRHFLITLSSISHT